MIAIRDAVTLSHYKTDIQMALVGPQGDPSTPLPTEGSADPAKCQEEGRVASAVRKNHAR